MRKPLLLSLAGAIAGCALSWVAYERLEADAGVRASIGPHEAEVRARRLAASYGTGVSGWPARVSAYRETRYRELRQRDPASPVVALFDPMIYAVRFQQPGSGGQLVLVELFGDGRPATYELRVPAGMRLKPTAVTPQEERMVLNDFAGASAVRFEPTSQVDTASQGSSANWEWKQPAGADVLPRIEASSWQGKITRAALRASYSDAFNKHYLALFDTMGIRLALGPLLIGVGIAITCSLFFPAAALGRVRWRSAVTLAAAIFSSYLLAFFAGGAYQPMLWNVTDETLQLARQILTQMGIATVMAGMWAAGRSRIADTELPRWQSFDWLLQGLVWQRRVGSSLLCGLLVGIGCVGIPSLVAWAGVGGKTGFFPVNSVATAPFPAALMFGVQLGVDLHSVLFLGVPFLVRRRGGWLPLIAIGALLVAVQRNPLAGGLGPNMVAGAFWTAAVLLVYRYVDLLAALTASFAGVGVAVAIVLLHQPSAILRQQGWLTAGLLAAVICGCAAIAVLGRRDGPILEDAQPAEREAEGRKLRAEFALARKAQQRFLPSVPPRVGRYSLAASCQPAREVGGDLYDFFQYPDGTYGVCVADVSGKGVPAALYMTMTKGLLAAASRDAADLRATASALNEHLHVAARKKTFVTMALGRLEPAAATLEFARAGHNAVLLYRANTRTASYLKPRGVGLGLTGNKLFDRSLALERVSLEPGDVVVFYSDGITEAMNPRLELFGEERLQTQLEAIAGHDAAAIEQHLLQQVRQFMAGEPPHDDMTLFVLKAGMEVS